ncbi:MAG: nucleoside hydrolase [Planctomycetaceae bacterium]|jgi:purine nucleosidase|nr:nucleoside hydrolase [Planctomycetaceae bacterium]MBT6155320.1 nucleoside hydrolase [Planctomycetaceae bacterium]MBT6485184.1 nucleoside hydrolase [Planctomycetaceae bacterium]MBT6497131.1 nucleoside hydrolase [Planctomycetaceae bacterium]
MKSKIVFRATWFAVLWGFVASPAGWAADKEPVRLIFDTDLESDVDDAGTVALLHALADRGEVKLLAMGVSARHPFSGPCLDAINTFYGRGDIPIGVLKGDGGGNKSKYAQRVAEEFPHDLKSSADAEDATKLYRRVLAAQPDGSVVMVSVGFLTNLANLLQSSADKHSRLSGKELVRRKIKVWVCMGGAFPKGREWNVFRDAKASQIAINGWPTRIVFSGYEIGKRVMTGARLAKLPKPHPVRRSYELYNGLKNRESWDQTAALYAVRGVRGELADFWDLSEPGTMRVLEDGSNDWQAQTDRNHVYLIQKLPPAKVAAAIEDLMLHIPPAAKR